METIEIHPLTSIEEAIKIVLQKAEQSHKRICAEFNGFILDSANSYDRNLDMYWAYMGRPNSKVDWEQRRYEIAKEMMSAVYLSNREDKRKAWNDSLPPEEIAEFAVSHADALVEKLRKNSQ